MSGVVGLGVVWAIGGILLGARWRAERARSPIDHAALPSLDGARFGQVRLGGSRQRMEAMLLSYAAGALLVSFGLLTRTGWLLALGVLLVNMGTIYRYLVVALDASLLDVPIVVRSERAKHRRTRPPVLRRALIGDLAK